MNLLNRNGRAIKPATPKPSDPITRAEAEAMARKAVEDQCVKICEFYMAQVPKLVVNMCNEVFKQHGIEASISLNEPKKDVIPGEAGDIQ